MFTHTRTPIRVTLRFDSAPLQGRCVFLYLFSRKSPSLPALDRPWHLSIGEEVLHVRSTDAQILTRFFHCQVVALHLGREQLFPHLVHVHSQPSHFGGQLRHQFLKHCRIHCLLFFRIPRKPHLSSLRRAPIGHTTRVLQDPHT